MDVEDVVAGGEDGGDVAPPSDQTDVEKNGLQEQGDGGTEPVSDGHHAQAHTTPAEDEVMMEVDVPAEEKAEGEENREDANQGGGEGEPEGEDEAERKEGRDTSEGKGEPEGGHRAMEEDGEGMRVSEGEPEGEDQAGREEGKDTSEAKGKPEGEHKAGEEDGEGKRKGDDEGEKRGGKGDEGGSEQKQNGEHEATEEASGERKEGEAESDKAERKRDKDVEGKSRDRGSRDHRDRDRDRDFRHRDNYRRDFRPYGGRGGGGGQYGGYRDRRMGYHNHRGGNYNQRRMFSRSRSRSPRRYGPQRDRRPRSPTPPRAREERSRSRERKSRRRRRSSSTSSSSSSGSDKAPKDKEVKKEKKEKKEKREKKHRASNWDMPPPTAIAAGLAGVPGAPPLPPGLPPSIEGFMPGMMAADPALGAANASALMNLGLGGLTGQVAQTPAAFINGLPVTQQMMRQAKRLYLGNVPLGVDEYSVVSLFNRAMIAAGKGSPEAPPILSCQVQPDKSYAFMEARSPEDATNCLQFDGITLGQNMIKVRRPKDYKPLPGQAPDPPLGQHIPVAGVIPTTVADTENKIYLGSVPAHLTEIQVRELISAFGELKAYNLVKDANTGVSKGYAFFEYVDSSLTDRVCTELHGFMLGDKKLVCQRANTTLRLAQQHLEQQSNPFAGLVIPGLTTVVPAATTIPGLSVLTTHGGAPGAPGPLTPPAPALPPPPPSEPYATRVIKLGNMVDLEELRDDNEYEDIVTDVRGECSKYGQVLSLKIPRPVYNEDGSVVTMPHGVGQVFVEFGDVEGARRATAALRNRQFSSRTVMCSFYQEADYDIGNLAL